MNKLVVIFYSFLILIQSFNVNIEDLSKFSALLEHANYHQETYGDNFFEFLSEHYGEEMASHENEHDEHQDLPFKDKHHMFTHINTVFTLFPKTTHSIYYNIFKESSLNYFYKEPFSLFEKPCVFQPPKLA